MICKVKFRTFPQFWSENNSSLLQAKLLPESKLCVTIFELIFKHFFCLWKWAAWIWAQAYKRICYGCFRTLVSLNKHNNRILKCFGNVCSGNPTMGAIVWWYFLPCSIYFLIVSNNPQNIPVLRTGISKKCTIFFSSSIKYFRIDRFIEIGENQYGGEYASGENWWVRIDGRELIGNWSVRTARIPCKSVEFVCIIETYWIY